MTLTITKEQRDALQAAKVVRRDIRKASKKAAPKVKPNRGRELDKGYLAYVRRLPCEARHLGGCGGPIEAAHIRYSDGPGRINPGLGRKNHDRHANPLCDAHHIHDQHRRKERDFWSSLGKDAYETAANHYSDYCRSMRGER